MSEKSLARRLLDVACRIRVGETLFHDDEIVDEAAHALAEPQSEPVAWMTKAAWGDSVSIDKPDFGKAEWKAPQPTVVPLYLHPPAQTPQGEPVAWIQPDHLQKARVAPFLCRVEPTKRMSDFVPIFLHPAQTTLTDDDKRDAERYRWLRQSNWTKRGMCVVANSSSVMLGHETLTHERLDAAIDEALKA